MKLAKTAKIELIVSKDKTHNVLQNVYLDYDKLVALDGRKLVQIPVVREDGDTDGYISPAQLQAARKQTNGSDPVSIQVNRTVKLADGTEMPRPSEDEFGTFPNYKAVIPNGAEHKQAIGINAKHLYEIAQAMGTDEVCIRIKDEMSSILVKPSGKTECPGAIGVLMPIRLS